MDISRSPCFQTKLGVCIPERRDKWKVIECVLSLVLQGNPHGYIDIILLPNKTGGVHSRKKRQIYSAERMDRIDITMFRDKNEGVHPRM